MILRFSSRGHSSLGKSFLCERLHLAQKYDRIAGYFTSSIFEIAGEALESIQGPVRVVCNSEVNARDLETAKSAALALKKEWHASRPEEQLLKGKDRFQRLYEFLITKKLQIKVLPSDAFGLVHGKAGVITLENGVKTSFLGSVNESKSAWLINYELLWEDNSADAINWVQNEFDALWCHPYARPLCEFIISEVDRLRHRVVITHLDEWRKEPNPASTVIEEPVYRESFGLGEHQKYFIKMAFEQHLSSHGARLILADSVGLGKTIQLAMAAQLMALHGTKPILVIVPKTLVLQWQSELKSLLDIPSAIWDGKKWIDEGNNETLAIGPEGIFRCPRKIGILSQGLITSDSEICKFLQQLNYECVIIDECHRARRRNLGPDTANHRADPNRLLEFMNEISPRTHSMLLATATPVQIYPIEAWDLLNVLAQGSENVMGNEFSIWRKNPELGIGLTMGTENMPLADADIWDITRNPFPQSSENPREFSTLRRNFKEPTLPVIPGRKWDELRLPDRAAIQKLSKVFARDYNPFIRHIVRRTREYLEKEIDPETKEPFLQPVGVRLFGEEKPIALPGYLQDAYSHAESFCQLMGKRVKSAGFLKTMILRRAGSTMEAGRLTAEKMLHRRPVDTLEEDDDSLNDYSSSGIYNDMSPQEMQALQNFAEALSINKAQDPKIEVVLRCLTEGVEETEPWINLGCIIFSQYYDSASWLAKCLVNSLPQEKIGLYAGGNKSGIYQDGDFKPYAREVIKKMVASHDIRLIVGTDAASEGINLQTLGTLINLDLPWNPTRLEQRKGRIQRIGQVRNTVLVYNMRYQGSVEDRVHELLSERLKTINDLFGQIPDVLEDIWVKVALSEIEDAKKKIASLPQQHPFEMKYSKVKKVDWESCRQVLDKQVKTKVLKQAWE